MTFFPPFVAEKILLSFFVVGLPMSIWYMTTSYDYKGGVIALLSFPLVYNYITYFGFYNFLFGSILYCLTMGFWLRYRVQKSLMTPVLLCSLLLAAYYTHLSSVIFLLLSMSILLTSEFLVYSNYKKTKSSDTQMLSLKEQAVVLMIVSLPVLTLLVVYFMNKF